MRLAAVILRGFWLADVPSGGLTVVNRHSGLVTGAELLVRLARVEYGSSSADQTCLVSAHLLAGIGRGCALRCRAASVDDSCPAAPGQAELAPGLATADQPTSLAWRVGREGARRPRARARATVSARVCVPSLAYRCFVWVLTVLWETYSSPAISGPVRLVGR